MALSAVQVIGVLFGLALLYFTYVHQKRNEFNVKEWLMWSGLAICWIIVAAFPGIIDSFTVPRGVRTMDFLIILGFMFLIYATLHIYTVLRSTQHKLEDLVRNNDMAEAQKTRKKSK